MSYLLPPLLVGVIILCTEFGKQVYLGGEQTLSLTPVPVTAMASSFWSKVPVKATAGSTKKVMLIRHGTTEMNEKLSFQPWGSRNFKDARLWDTVLSARGLSQAEALNTQLKKTVLPEEIQLIVASPLTRAIETAELAFRGFPPEIPRMVLPLARERLYLSSDVGVRRSTLQTRYPKWDFSAIPNDDPWWYTFNADSGDEYVEWRPSGEYACPGEPEDVFRDRLIQLRGWLESRPEETIALVTHWGVVRGLTSESFSNCEMRVFNVSSLRKVPVIDD
jgi:glucosyl-3-phosphoglycerate phosphatase